MNDDVHQEPKTLRNDAPLKTIVSATTKLESQDVKPLRPWLRTSQRKVP